MIDVCGFPLKLTILFYTKVTFIRELNDVLLIRLPIPPVSAFTLFLHVEPVIICHSPLEYYFVSTSSCIHLYSCKQIISSCVAFSDAIISKNLFSFFNVRIRW